jgi:UDP-2,4-diacetamido-2,4,6-trideoxy-beta-L-altropyranose hydrolase
MKVILRADGNKTIGMGHIYRLIALAGILKEKFNCVFATSCTEDYIIGQIKEYCSDIIILPSDMIHRDPAVVLEQPEVEFDLEEYVNGDEIIVLDGYWFREEYQRRAKSKNSKLVVIDDFGQNSLSADIILNHAPGIDKSIYRLQDKTRLCTGLEYALIRKIFFKPFLLDKGDKNVLFISLGTGDCRGLAMSISKSLFQKNLFAKIHILVSGSLNEHVLNTLDELSVSSSNAISIHRNLNAADVVEILDTCTHALVSASTVLIESYARGLTCFTGFFVPNQFFIYNGFVSCQMAFGMGNLNQLDTEYAVSFIGERISSSKEVIHVSRVPLSSDTNILKLFTSI